VSVAAEVCFFRFFHNLSYFLEKSVTVGHAIQLYVQICCASYQFFLLSNGRIFLYYAVFEPIYILLSFLMLKKVLKYSASKQ